jgi:hypothetical protein
VVDGVAGYVLHSELAKPAVYQHLAAAPRSIKQR